MSTYVPHLLLPAFSIITPTQRMTKILLWTGFPNPYGSSEFFLRLTHCQVWGNIQEYHIISITILVFLLHLPWDTSYFLHFYLILITIQNTYRKPFHSFIELAPLIVLDDFWLVFISYQTLTSRNSASKEGAI